MNEKLNEIYQAAGNGDYQQAAKLIEEGLHADPSLARQNNIGFAHWLVLGAKWGLITKLIPPGTNFFLESGWLNSLAATKPVNKTGEPVPWFTYPAIDFLDPRVKPEWKVLEYGSGQSTFWWAKRVAKIYSAEHDRQWFEMMNKNLPSNATIDLCTDREEYVEAIVTSSMAPFDVVVIDGEFRNECARLIPPYIHDDGIIIFDNSDRIMFRDGVEYLSTNGWKRIDFFGLCPSYLYKSCTSIFFRHESWLSSAPMPCDQTLSTGATCSQAIRE